MGQQRNAKLIRRKIRQELRPVYQDIGGIAQALHQHLTEKTKPIQELNDQETASKAAAAVVPEAT